MKAKMNYKTLSFVMMLLGITALWGGMIWATGTRESFHPAGIGIAVFGVCLVVVAYPIYLKYKMKYADKEKE